MDNIQFLDLINAIIAPITGVVCWFVGRRKQRNDFLSELQASINLLAEKNSEQMKEIIKLREEVVNLRGENSRLSEEVESLSKKLENVKTITRTKADETKH